MNDRVIVFNSFGKQDVAIVNKDYLPNCAFLNNHLGITYSGSALNTKQTYAHALLFVYRYFESKDIDLVNRVESGNFLTNEELVNFGRHCEFKVAADSSKIVKVLNFVRVSEKQIDAKIHETASSEDRASAQTIKGRWNQLKYYLDYLYTTFHLGNKISSNTSNAYIAIEREIKKRIRGIKEENTVVKDPFKSVIPDEIFFRMLEIVCPSHKDNPFKGSRLRNFLIISIFCETGMRVGALAKLKISNVIIDWDNPRLLVTRTPNDPTDSRKRKPAQKTKAHASAISNSLMKTIQHYIATDRSKFTKSNTHDFVFLSEKGTNKGEPLSTKGFYNIVKTLSNAIDFHLWPHLLRHKNNEVFDIKATAKGYTSEQIEDIRKYAMGWSEASEMGAIYNEFRNAVKVREIMSGDQSQWFSKKEDKSDGS